MPEVRPALALGQVQSASTVEFGRFSGCLEMSWAMTAAGRQEVMSRESINPVRTQASHNPSQSNSGVCRRARPGFGISSSTRTVCLVRPVRCQDLVKSHRPRSTPPTPLRGRWHATSVGAASGEPSMEDSKPVYLRPDGSPRTSKRQQWNLSWEVLQR